MPGANCAFPGCNVSRYKLGVIHKVRTLGKGRGGPSKSVLSRMGEGEVQLEVHVRHNFFSQVPYKLEIK